MSLLNIRFLSLAFFKKLRSKGLLVFSVISLTLLLDHFDLNFLLVLAFVFNIGNLLFVFSLELGLLFFVQLLPLLIQLVPEIILFLGPLIS
jgi:hypothetical protein